VKIVTPKRLRQGLSQIRQELQQLGFLSEGVRKVRVKLTPFGTAYGYQYYGSSGDICIPALSLSRFSTLLGYPYTSLRDVLRHEYGHAVADLHRGLIRSRKFSSAFGSGHCFEKREEFHPEVHLTPYAAHSPGEDFAETFMIYVRTAGVLPACHQSKAIKSKWLFLRELSKSISRRMTRWR
jgi:hypothetical protein